MKIALATDHAGFEQKELLKTRLGSEGHEVVDFGATELNADDDYPDFIFPAAEAVARGECERGIFLGGSGQGEAIAANKVKGIRAVVFNGQYLPVDGRKTPPEIHLSREHNDANVLTLGARFLSVAETFAAVDEWLTTPFSNEERHRRRVEKIAEYEQKN